jgi:3D (Asp-Asp-Asp) domain-containing protein
MKLSVSDARIINNTMKLGMKKKGNSYYFIVLSVVASLFLGGWLSANPSVAKFSATGTAQAMMNDPAPTTTPTLFVNPTLRNISIFTYSFYNPSLGGSNCLTWDSAGENCVSKMSSGYDYWDYYNIAVACPPEYPTGTIIRVVSPHVLAHNWVCMDTGGAIVGNRLDFLQRNQVLPWNTEIDAIVTYRCDSCR